MRAVQTRFISIHRIALVAAASLTPLPLAAVQERFGPGAELYGKGIFSTAAYELPPTFTADGRTAYFTVSTPAYGRLHVIMETTLSGGRWTTPRIAPFSGQYGDADPLISPDGRRLFFLSRRPLTPGGKPRDDFDIFYLERTGAGWGPPIHVAAASGPDAEHYASVASDGTLYIAAIRPDSKGRGDIYRVPFIDGEYRTPESLGPAVNSPDHHDTTPFIAPDQSYVIFSSWGRSDNLGSGGDLYISWRGADGSWSPAQNLGPLVNSTRTEYCPVVSHDGAWLYFASERGFADRPLTARLDARDWNARLAAPGNGLGDTWRIPLRTILAAHPQPR